MRKTEKKKKKNDDGITLIALVITIIVLLILTGVTMAMLLGDNGIITKAQEAKTQTEIAEWEERIDLVIAGAMIKEDATIEDIIEGLKKEEIIDDESQVNRETGDITTNSPSYVISDKLDDYLSNIKINISKIPESETSSIVYLEVESVEGIEEINLNKLDISKLSQTEKENLLKEIVLFQENNFGGGHYYASFEEFIEKNFGGNEQYFWEVIEEYGGIDSQLEEIIETLKEKNVETINGYKVINPEEEESSTYFATENATYTFKIKDIITGQVYTKTVEVTNIDTNQEYYVKSLEFDIFLLDKENNEVDFEQAYIIYKGERIDISSCIDKEEVSYMRIYNVAWYLEEIQKVDDQDELTETRQIFEIVKDGKSYFGAVLIHWEE